MSATPPDDPADLAVPGETDPWGDPVRVPSRAALSSLRARADEEMERESPWD